MHILRREMSEIFRKSELIVRLKLAQMLTQNCILLIKRTKIAQTKHRRRQLPKNDMRLAADKI